MQWCILSSKTHVRKVNSLTGGLDIESLFDSN